MNITQKRMLVQNNLRAIPYKDKQRIEQAVMQLLGQIHSLQPKVEAYVFNNGAQQRLFKLDGTIPINYQGKQYNIPIAMWLPLEFPTRPPMVYVTPVSGMRIKDRHRHVDPQGFVYHPYLHSWSTKSSLVDLVGLLCSTFGADPPVFSGPPSSAASRPAYGGGRGGGAQQPPQYGGYPGGGRGGGPVPYGARPGAAGPAAGRGAPYGAQPGYGQPAQPAQPYGMGGPGPAPGGYPGPQYGQPPPPHQGQPQYQQPPGFGQPPQPPAPSGGGGYGSRMANAVGGAFGAALGRGGPTQQEMDVELRKNVEAKLRKELQKLYDKENLEMNKYMEQQKRLEENQSRIDEMETQLRRENEELTEQASKLVMKISELESWLSENEGKDEIDVSTAIMPTDTWAEQCLGACAADQACTDVMRELDRALEDERIRLQVYLREIRKLARTQFEHRALAHEVLKKQQRNVGTAANTGPPGGPPPGGAARGGGPYFSQYAARS